MLKRRLAIAIAVAALLGGGAAVALGATGGSSSTGHRAGKHDGLFGVAASYLGVEARQLHLELRQGRTLGQIADATPGRSEAGLVAALLKARETDLSARISALVDRQHTGRIAAKHQRPRHRRLRASLRAAVLSYLGITPAQLRADLRSGKSLAQIAEATAGKSAAGLSSAILAAADQRLAKSAQS
jgi:hypothetical protein